MTEPGADPRDLVPPAFRWLATAQDRGTVELHAALKDLLHDRTEGYAPETTRVQQIVEFHDRAGSPDRIQDALVQFLQDAEDATHWDPAATRRLLIAAWKTDIFSRYRTRRKSTESLRRLLEVSLDEGLTDLAAVSLSLIADARVSISDELLATAETACGPQALSSLFRIRRRLQPTEAIEWLLEQVALEHARRILVLEALWLDEHAVEDLKGSILLSALDTAEIDPEVRQALRTAVEEALRGVLRQPSDWEERPAETAPKQSLDVVVEDLSGDSPDEMVEGEFLESVAERMQEVAYE